MVARARPGGQGYPLALRWPWWLMNTYHVPPFWRILTPIGFSFSTLRDGQCPGDGLSHRLAMATAMPYTLLMQTIIETPAYLSDAKALGPTDAERTAIVDYIAQHPSAGEVMSGTGVARKVRFGGRGKGKSGGYRVITFYSGEDIPVFLLNIFAKGEKVNLTKAEQNELRAILADVVAAYRGGVRRYVESRQPDSRQRASSPGVRHRRGRR
jgi:hypothetical protein